jgi:hypothetical protein
VVERIGKELREKSETLDRYIQESAQMARMIVEADGEKKGVQNQIMQMEIILNEKSDLLERYINESALMAQMIIERKNERDIWRGLNVITEIGTIILGSRHENGDHQHINCKLKEVKSNGNSFHEIDVRIVSHLNNSGIVIFDVDELKKPLASWKTSGIENKKEYFLLIPNEQSGKRWIKKTNFNDYSIVRDIQRYIYAELKQKAVTDKSLEKWVLICGDFEGKLQKNKGLDAVMRSHK